MIINLLTILFVSHGSFAGPKTVQGQIYSAEPKVTIRNEYGSTLELRDGEKVQLIGAEKGMFMDSRVRVQSSNGTLSFSVPRRNFSEDNTFTETEGKNGATKLSSQIIRGEKEKTWEQLVSESCNTTRDCGQYHCFGYNSDFQCVAQMWVSTPCIGSQQVAYEKTQFGDRYQLNLGETAVFMSEPELRIESRRLRVTRKCD